MLILFCGYKDHLYVVLESSLAWNSYFFLNLCLYSWVSKAFSLDSFCGFQNKAAKELAENRNKIDALLDWVTAVRSEGQMEQLSATSLGKGAFDTTDAHEGASQAPEELDKQCEKMKVRMLACLHSAGHLSAALGKSP